MPENYDAIIIGAGVIGAAIGYEMAKKGQKTINIDMGPEAGYGSTAASCAIIRVHYSTFDGCAIAWEGYHYWKKWEDYLGVADESGLAKFIECGAMVYKTEVNGYLEKVMANAAALNIPFDELDAAAIEAKLPIAQTASVGPPKAMDDPDFDKKGDPVRGAVYFPTAGYITDPKLSAHNLQRAAEAHGATFRYRTKIVEILVEDGKTAGVKLEDGSEVRAPVVVNVAGPHSFKVNRMAKLQDGSTVEDHCNIKTQALKVEVSHVPPPPGFNYEKDAFVTSDSDIGCYTRPEHGNHILIGSEDPECDPRIFVDPDDWDDSFSDQWKAQVYRLGLRYPDLPVTPPVKGVVSLYDAADDWIPIYDKSDLPGFYMAIGTSGNQYKNAPVAGALMAELIEKVQAGHDHDKEPVQFDLKHIGKTISLGFYSRNREINTESSMSVIG